MTYVEYENSVSKWTPYSETQIAESNTNYKYKINLIEQCDDMIVLSFHWF